MMKGTGCGYLGENPDSHQADSQTEWAYLLDNQALLMDAAGKKSVTSLPQYQAHIDQH